MLTDLQPSDHPGSQTCFLFDFKGKIQRENLQRETPEENKWDSLGAIGEIVENGPHFRKRWRFASALAC